MGKTKTPTTTTMPRSNQEELAEEEAPICNEFRKVTTAVSLPTIWIAAALFTIAIAVLATTLSFHQTQIDLTLFFSPSNNHQNNTSVILSSEEDVCTCNEADLPTSSLLVPSFVSRNVSECCCSFGDIEETNRKTVSPILQRVVETPFFAHFKMNLLSDCALWDDAPLCILRDCSVSECDEPPLWALQTQCHTSEEDHDDEDYLNDDRIVTTVDPLVRDHWQAPPMSFLDTLSTTSEESSVHTTDTAVVVDLRRNPERYTGYGGSSAAKVWSAVHQDNCFSAQANCSLPSEQRVYNRVISGMHSSISLHIAQKYCLQLDPDRLGECLTWGSNTKLARERVLNHPERLENLYVAFAVLLRAVQKAGSAITAAVPNDDDLFAESISEWQDVLLPKIEQWATTCPMAFDESSLRGDDPTELQRRFRHLQKIMQCVGCDRCKLWGTLQTLGVGTALRVLLVPEDEQVDLSRQEAVALVHTLERFSSSLAFAQELLEE